MHKQPNSSFQRLAVCHLCSHTLQNSSHRTILMPYDSPVAINLVPKNKLCIMYLPFSGSMNNIQKPPNCFPRDSFTLLYRLPKGRSTKQEETGDHWVLFLLSDFRKAFLLYFFFKQTDTKVFGISQIQQQEMNSKNITSHFSNDSLKCNILLLDCDL